MDAANVDNVRPILNVTVTLKIALRKVFSTSTCHASHFYFHLSKEKQSMHQISSYTVNSVTRLPTCTASE